MTNQEAMDYPERYLAYFALFNRGEFWESHEVLEGFWLEDRHDEHGRLDFFQGLISLSAAYEHVRRGNGGPADTLFRQARRLLEPYAPSYMGIDLTGLLAHIDRCLAAASVQAVPPLTIWPQGRQPG